MFVDLNIHRPYQRIAGADTMVLCVHGIQGSPAQFQWLVSGLPDEVDYMCVLLPGHGQTMREFERSGKAEWESCIRALCADLNQRYKNVIYVGHSMGCLLGIMAAADEGRFKGMLLLACPLKLKLPVRYLKELFKGVRGQESAGDTLREANSVYVESAWEYGRAVKPYLGLLALIRASKRALRDLQIDITAVHSDGDEIVGRAALELLQNQMGAKAVVVPDSGHYCYSMLAKSMISDELAHMIQGASSLSEGRCASPGRGVE